MKLAGALKILFNIFLDYGPQKVVNSLFGRKFDLNSGIYNNVYHGPICKLSLFFENRFTHRI